MNPNIRGHKEVVLLVEQDSFRPMIVDPRKDVRLVVEREHLSESHVRERVWEWRHDERAETGQRIFREHLAPIAASEAGENPLYDEMVIKEPLRFTSRQTPNGFGPDTPATPTQFDEIRPIINKLD